MRDVARLADVSIATVSFVINDTKPVAPATRARVEEAMLQLGYRRNALGRALASKRTRIIALLYPALQRRLSETAVKFFTSATQTAKDLGYNLVL
jgi:DNA-binding LacI/PurR family transcriptional regulator